MGSPQRSGSVSRSSPALRSHLALGVALGVCCAFCGQIASADEVQQQLQRMDARITQLEQQLEATDDELTAANARVASQQEVIERAGLHDQERSLSGIARWLQETEFDGWVAASYWWNANQPNPGTNGNRGNLQLGSEANGLAYPLHPEHNSFQLDQLWFGMQKNATAESRGGYGVDIVYGATADQLRADGSRGADLSNVFQAYAEYLAPLGPGILIRAGRIETHIGTEEIGTVHNFNISTGLVYNLLEPANFVGLTAESSFGPVTLMLGASNDSYLNLNTDNNDGKSLLWGLGFDVAETLAISINGLWGDSAVLPGADTLPPGTTVAPRNDRVGIVNLVVQWDPSDLFSAWLDFDYVWTRDQEAIIQGSLMPVPGHPRAYGVALASRYALAEQTGFGFRGEVIYSRDYFLDPTMISGSSDHTLWSLTGTLDHTFAENFVVRVEARYDAGEQEGSDAVFYRDTDPGEFRSNQFVAGVQAYYRF